MSLGVRRGLHLLGAGVQHWNRAGAQHGTKVPAKPREGLVVEHGADERVVSFGLGVNSSRPTGQTHLVRTGVSGSPNRAT